MGHLRAGLTSQTMGLLHLLPLLALCHGAALPEAEHLDLETIMDTLQDMVANPSPYMESFGIRSKRHAEVEDHTGFEEFPIPFLGAAVGVKYTGVIHGTMGYKMQPKKPTKVKVEIKKGADIVLQVAIEMKTTIGGKVQFRGKYSVMGGKVAQGNLSGKYENGV